MRDAEGQKKFSGAINILLGLTSTIAGIVAVLGLAYLTVWIINLIAG